MGKKNEANVKVKSGAPRKNHSNVRVTKEIKRIAAFTKMRGGSYRQTILVLGAAEKNFRDGGRLVHGASRGGDE